MPISGVELYSFIFLVMMMIVSPGANQILVLQSGMVLGHKAAIYNVMGITSSMFIHGAITGLGIAFVIVKSPSLYQALKLLGVGYIAYLAVASLISAQKLRSRQRGNISPVGQADKLPAESGLKSFAKGFTGNILNVQTLIVFLSIFPQYMNPEHELFTQSLFLTLVFIGLLICWYSALIALIFRVRRHLVQPAVQIRIKMVTGSLLLFMAIKMFLK